jgi:Chalcone isomerase-like
MKKTTFLVALLALSAAAAAARAAEVAGVKLADTVDVEGKTLKLNGAGLRKRMLFKVYVAGLYVETPSKDAATLISSSQMKSMQLHILRSLKGAKITEAIEDGFERNSRAALPQLKPRLDNLAKMIPDVAEGDTIWLTWVPDEGTRVTVRGTNVGTIEGRDFADALFSVWLGPDPVQDDLKKALLGG